MEALSYKNELAIDDYQPESRVINEIVYLLQSFSGEEMATFLERITKFKAFFQRDTLPKLEDFFIALSGAPCKTSFLVFKNNKYVTVPIESIAFFYVRNESSMMMCFNGDEYYVNYSLEQIQNFLTCKQFFRLNRQYLINFSAVKEVEHYFKRTLFLKLVIQAPDKLIISKKKSCCFLKWLEDR